MSLIFLEQEFEKQETAVKIIQVIILIYSACISGISGLRVYLFLVYPQFSQFFDSIFVTIDIVGSRFLCIDDENDKLLNCLSQPLSPLFLM